MAGVSRRDVLATTGAALGAGAVGAVSMPVSAEIDSDVVPDHVSITYDEARLERWQPYMALSIDANNNLTGVYGYVATSEEWEYDVLAYWARYAVQTGLLSWDSHQYDHEPVYVFIDSSASEPAPPEALDRVVYTAYHHYSASFAPTVEDLSGSRQSDAETHISLDVVDPYHQYQRAPAGTGILPSLRDWTSARPEWEAYGFYENTSREAVDVPITMLDRESWWGDETLEARLAALYVRLGIGADERDELDREA